MKSEPMFGIKHSYTGLFGIRPAFFIFNLLLLLHQQKTDSYAAQGWETIDRNHCKTVGKD